MDINQMATLVIPSYSYIGNLIPKDQLTLLAGLAGTGKTYSMIKFLNIEGIIPIYVNLDFTPIPNVTANMYDDVLLKYLIIDDDISGIEGTVIVIDTYQRLSNYVEDEMKLKGVELQRWITDKLEYACSKHRCTIVVIGHPEDYVGKDGIFKDNPIMVRNCAEYLHLDCILPRGKTGGTSDIEYKLTVKKGRGSGGSRIIDNWMRQKMKNPFNDKLF